MSNYEGVPESMTDVRDWCFRISRVLNNVMRGRTNNVGTVTLTANAVSTVVTLAKGVLSNDSAIIFDPLTANAATELYGATMYVATANRDVTNKQFTITHANNANADRSFRYIIVG